MKQQAIQLNRSVSIDLSSLINTRLLVQANSGGGKSWLLRRILEQSHGKIHQIVIDLEGEFSTLREKYDYILAGKGGDVAAESRSAALLARKLLELNVSAIIDLYELKHQERKHFVKLFLDAMVNAPKNLWHPCLVIIDEAHIFCPEKGQAESMESVIDLATRGRKRGYCAVLATQRLSKLHKDAAAECNNKLIGRTGLDIDMKRAYEELGFTSKEQYLSLRKLEAGEFYGFGPAVSREVIPLKVGGVKTTHPQAGSRILSKATTPPTQKIKSVLKKLSDLPEEARKEAATIADMKKELMQLRRHRCPKVTSKKDIEAAVKHAVWKHGLEWERVVKTWQEYVKNLHKIFSDSETKRKALKLPKALPKYTFTPSNLEPASFKINVEPRYKQMAQDVASKAKEKSEHTAVDTGQVDREIKITGGAMRMLKVLVSRYPMELTKAQLATFAKLSPRSGTYGTYLSALRSAGFIEESNGLFKASEAGIDSLGEAPAPPQTSEEVIEMWRSNLNGGAKRIFDAVVSCYPDALSKEEVGEQTDLVPSSGTFNTYLSMLRSNSLIEVEGQMIKASDNLFM